MEEGKPKRTSEAPSISSAMTSCLALGSEMSSASQGTEWVSLGRAPALWWEPAFPGWLSITHHRRTYSWFRLCFLPSLPLQPCLKYCLGFPDA